MNSGICCIRWSSWDSAQRYESVGKGFILFFYLMNTLKQLAFSPKMWKCTDIWNFDLRVFMIYLHSIYLHLCSGGLFRGSRAYLIDSMMLTSSLDSYTSLLGRTRRFVFQVRWILRPCLFFLIILFFFLILPHPIFCSALSHNSSASLLPRQGLFLSWDLTLISLVSISRWV